MFLLSRLRYLCTIFEFSDMKFYAVETEDMNDIWYPSIYIGNGLKFKNQESFGPEPKSLNSLW